MSDAVHSALLHGVHGGPDAQGIPRWDFSTNANACGPAPHALAAVQAADASRYPDPSYTALRQALARWHGVEAARIVLAASASEFIARLSTALALAEPGARISVPAAAYGDYARAALAAGLRLDGPGPVRLQWWAEPSSPAGEAEAPPRDVNALIVIDRAYAPLRLSGTAPALPPSAWQLWSPNKALGLTGVRGAYAVAPDTADGARWAARLQALAPSWPLGAQGVAMLGAWVEPATQDWLAASLPTLRDWKQQQLTLCARLGWTCAPSVTPYFLARWPGSDDTARRAATLAAWRAQGLKLRDAASMGRPGWLRLSVQGPAAQAALQQIVERTSS